MGVMVGSIVKPCEPLDPDEEYTKGLTFYFTCETDVEDETPECHECIGIVIEYREEDAKVNWLQFCRYHINEVPKHQWVHYSRLWDYR